ncbi:MAG: VPLPA-CTERM sorting domain-containing protein [Candidatus Thiodiazotropha sp.]
MDIMKLNGFIALVLLSPLITAPSIAAVPGDYIGGWHVTAYGDNDFSDGVALTAYDLSVNFALSPDPARDLDFNILDTNTGGILNTTLNMDSQGVARITANDVPWPGVWPEFPTYLGDAVVLTEGNGMAMGVVGRDPTDRDQTGFFYSLWGKSPISTVSAEDFLGIWKTSQVVNSLNLRTSGGLTSSLFPISTITAGSNPDTLLIDLDRTDIDPIELQVAGNHAFLSAPIDTGSSMLLALDLIHDGENILFAVVNQEYHDLTDIALDVGISSPVPLPAAVWFLISGIGFFGILGYRTGKDKQDTQ